MAEQSLSSLGAFSYLLNCFSPFSIYIIPLQFYIGSFWILAPVLILAAGLSYLASSFLITLTDLCLHEQAGPKQPLIPVPLEQRRSELTITKLVTDSCGYGLSSSLLATLTLYCLLLGLMDLGLFGTDYFEKIYADKNHRLIGVALFAIAISIMNRFSLKQLEYPHIVMALCRLAYVGIWAVFFRGWKMSEFKPHEFLSIFIAAFIYQLPLHSILSGHRAPAKQQKLLHAITITIYLLIFFMYVFLGMADHKDAEKNQQARSAIHVLLVISNLATSQICWKAFTGLLITWRYGHDIQAAKYSYPWRIFLIETFAHYPLYLLYAVLMFYDTDEYKFMYLTRFLTYVSSAGLILYWVTIYCYQAKKASFTYENISNYTEFLASDSLVTVFKWLLGAFLLLFVGYLWWGVVEVMLNVKLHVYPVLNALIVLIVMIIWAMCGR